MKIENWKYGYVSGKTVIVFNNQTYSFYILKGHFLENVKLEIGDGGTLRVTGDEICYDYYRHETPEEDWEGEPESEKSIKIRKTWLFWGKEKKYLVGWVRTKKREPIDLEFCGDWTIERRD